MIDPIFRLTGGIFLDAHFTAPWCVHTNILAEDCGAFLVKPPVCTENLIRVDDVKKSPKLAE